MGKKWGFDTKTIDKKVRPQDDFFSYANGGWIQKTKMPADESRWGSFVILGHKTHKELKAIIDDLQRKKLPKKGESAQLVRDVFSAAIDMKTRDSLDTKPLLKWRRMIESIKTKEDLIAYLSKADRAGVSGLWGAYIDQDSKDSSRYLLHFYQGGLGMPDRDYYLKDAPEQARVREAYIKHIGKLLGLDGKSTPEIKGYSEAVMRVEKRLALASMPREEARDVEKTYHKLSISALSKMASAVNWHFYLKEQGAKNVRECIVAQPKFFTEVSKMIGEVPLFDWKMYLEWHLLNNSAGMLSSAFVRENFDFYGRTLTGAKKMKPLWRRALGSVNGQVGHALGKLYVEKHFTKDAKKRMNSLVNDLFVAYERRIKALDWMSSRTKKKAVSKMRMMNRKIGFPSRFKTYKGLMIKPDDFFGNALRAHEYAHRREMRKLLKKVDRAEWFMTPQTVNAYCNFNLNEIVFPAAILQPPFFDFYADDAINYAGIGAVIGHEVTHGFDDQGAKFDGHGNMKSWWTKPDKKRFQKKASLLKKQFDAYVAAPGVNVNGTLTLGENIADLGGLSIAFDAYQARLKKTGRYDIQGFTPEQRFFLGFAQAEREIARPEFLKTLALVDPHSPAPFRVNGPLSNFKHFYEAFGVTKKDALYRKSSRRAKVW
jgi:putative endopeptidase